MSAIPRRIIIPHPVHFETWDYNTPDTRGIGNSETAQIELAWRFAQRGWEVICYAPLPEGTPPDWRGTKWLPLDQIDYSLDGYWIIWRYPEMLDQFPLDHPGKRLFLTSQDEDYPHRWTDERCAKLDGLFALCESHRMSLEKDHPGLKGKVKVVANGIKLNLLEAVDQAVAAGEIVRDPHRIMWASSPDRGLLRLLKIFRRVREWVSDATLYCYYGFENADKLIAIDAQRFRWLAKEKEAILREANQPGVHWVGRIPQPELMREWAKSGLIVYPSIFRETFGTTHVEAQALGAFSITSGVWALGEHTHAGSIIAGDPEDELIASRYVGEIYRWMTDENLEQVRKPMMEAARMAWNYERAVDKYEAHLLGFAEHSHTHSQFNFQLKHCLPVNGLQPTILNVGCADDPAEFRKLGAVNMDAREEDPIFHRKTAADLIADMRDLPNCLNGKKFDRIVFGDCLEHFVPEAVPQILRRAKRALNPGGRIIITVPDDHRTPDVQHAGSDGSHEYLDGVSAVHLHPIPKEMIEGWCREAGLAIETYQDIYCHHYWARGVVCVSDTPASDSLDRIDEILAESNLEQEAAQ